jgi:GMP reductase
MVDFEDVTAIPAFSTVSSRAADCSVDVSFGGRVFKSPVVLANMRSAIDEALALKLAEAGYFYVMHRFGVDPVAFTQMMHAAGAFASISLGVKDEDYRNVDRFVELGLTPEYITIDIAHGHSALMRNILIYIKEKLPDAFVIAGNVATPEAVQGLESWGADATKIGIGPGKVCITKNKTRVGTGGWQLGAVRQCTQAATKPTIADGGIREHGDVALAVGFGGATMVMFASLFAGCDDTPGEVCEENGIKCKRYFGSASAENRPDRPPKNIEGKGMSVPCNNRTVVNLLEEMGDDFRSSISYVGGRCLRDLGKAHYLITKFFFGIRCKGVLPK